MEYYEGLLDCMREELSNSNNLSYYIKSLLCHPIFTPRMIERKFGMPNTSLSRFVYFLEDHKFLVRENKKSCINFMFTEIYALFEL